MELGAPECRSRYILALLLFARGDAAGYRSECRSLMEKFKQTENPLEAHHVAWACVLAPEAMADFTPAIDLAERAFAEDSSHSCLNTLGALLYRDGQLEAAVDKLSQARKIHRGGGHAFDWIFLALAHGKRNQEGKPGERAAAIEFFKRAASLIGGGATKEPAPAAPARRGSWVQRLDFKLLHAVARSLLQN